MDLSETDRFKRRICFKAIERRSASEPFWVLTERLLLEQLGTKRYRLTRTLSDTSLIARLRTEGSDPSLLMARVDAVDPWHQFRCIAGRRVAISYRVDGVPRKESSSADVNPYRLAFLEAVADLDGIALVLDARVGPGMPAGIRMDVAPQWPINPPVDLLAVLGRHWGLLNCAGGGWRASLRLIDSEPGRTLDLEVKLQRLVEHLVATFCAPPERFHPTWKQERLRVMLRSAVWLAGGTAFVAAGSALLLLGAPEGSLRRLLAFLIPACLVVMLLARHEAPRMRLPALARPLAPNAWVPKMNTSGDQTEGKRADGEQRSDPPLTASMEVLCEGGASPRANAGAG